MTDDERRALEAKCSRRAIENLNIAAKQIGPRTRMIQIC